MRTLNRITGSLVLTALLGACGQPMAFGWLLWSHSLFAEEYEAPAILKQVALPLLFHVY